MDSAKKVSVIVPVYNAESYLPETLGNLMHQTLDNIEIILINDASTDNSLSVLTACERRFSDRVLLINCDENRGAGGARNVGLDYASGEYVGFADCDDLTAVDMFEKLYNTAKEHDADIVDSGYLFEKAGRSMLHTADDMTGKLDDFKRSQLIVSGGYNPTHLFRRSLIERHGLRFRERVILEDADFLTFLLATADSIWNIKEVLYCYKNRPHSLTTLSDTDNYFYNITEAMRAVYDKTHTLKNYAGIRKAVEYELIQMYSYGVNVCLKSIRNQEKERKEVLRMLKKIASLKRDIIPGMTAGIASGGYDNSFVRNKIDALDIRIMKKNDQSPEELLDSLI